MKETTWVTAFVLAIVFWIVATVTNSAPKLSPTFKWVIIAITGIVIVGILLHLNGAAS